MTTTAAKTAVQAFICCRLDYCNSILYGMSDGLLRKVQSIQNAAAHLVTGVRRCDHITPVLRQLHCLPVHQRVEYKVACLVHQSLAGQTPAYVADDIQLVTDNDRRQLRSAAAWTCLIPRTHNNFGDRSFGAVGPRMWNSLPPHLRRDMNFAHFKRQLKTFLFGS